MLLDIQMSAALQMQVRRVCLKVCAFMLSDCVSLHSMTDGFLACRQAIEKAIITTFTNTTQMLSLLSI